MMVGEMVGSRIFDVLHLRSSSLEEYLGTIKQIKILTPDEEQELFIKFHVNKDLGAAQTIILSNLRYVWCVARAYKGYNVPIDELIQEGTIGLMKAVKKFDPMKGNRFITYAAYQIKYEIINFIINNFKQCKSITTKNHRKLFFNLHKFNRSLSLSDEEISTIINELGVREKDIRYMEGVIYGRDVELDKIIEGNGNGTNTDTEVYGNILLGDGGQNDPITELEELEELEMEERLKNRVMELIEGLDDRDYDIIKSRFLTSEKPTPRKLLASKYNISQQRIEQIEKDIFLKIKNQISSEGGDSC